MKKYIPSTLLIFLFIILWEVVARMVDLDFLFPTPSAVIMELWELRTILITEHLPSTLLIIIIGLAISILFGVGLAIAMNQSKAVEQTFYPIIIISQTIPIIALAPIFVLWFGYSIWSKVAVTILISFFPITISTFDGFRSKSKEIQELLLTMGASRKDIFLKLDIPSAIPYFYSGLKVAVPLSVIGAAIGEWLGAQVGLGYFSRRMMTQFDGAGVFAPVVLLSMLGILLFLIVVWMEEHVLKWRK
ncbi:ABC transporter permease [Virgibacillus sp. SK37]|uniref:ABC transporter permease n=1 Tax=Virgibacillus sp. SK37 TaxID=403957 RepID=UPI0004D0D618|nr:ABC transporter permease [Virgibacillus sp. SK37]AIF42775.1 ABC transporter permease [Virgibacillus sp. SK37]